MFVILSLVSKFSLFTGNQKEITIHNQIEKGILELWGNFAKLGASIVIREKYSP